MCDRISDLLERKDHEIPDKFLDTWAKTQTKKLYDLPWTTHTVEN